MQLSNYSPQEILEFSVIRESVFYGELKSAAETGDKSNFALLLSMLTNDAMELDEFHLPQDVKQTKKLDLYKQFNIQLRPVVGELSSTRSISNNELIHQGLKQSIELDLAVKPEALMSEQLPIAPQIFNNLDPNVRARFNNNNTSKLENIETATTPITKPDTYEIDIESWFNVLQESRTLAAIA